MSNPTNWPDPERPGVPMFPERDGWHWIDTGLASGMRPLFWQSKSQSWFASADTCANRWKHTDSWKYHGPCLTPAQISEMLVAERERCAKVCDDLADDFLPCHPSEYAREIRELGAAA